jgi:hypothetical protein
VRETEEQARARRAAAGRQSRRSLDEEIEEEIEAALEDEDFDFFGLRESDE